MKLFNLNDNEEEGLLIKEEAKQAPFAPINIKDLDTKIDANRSLIGQYIEFIKPQKEEKAKIERMKKLEKATLMGNALSLIGKGVAAWGGIKPKPIDYTSFYRSQQARREQENYNNLLDKEYKTYTLNDLYRKDAELKNDKNTELNRQTQILINKDKIEYDKVKSENNRQFEVNKILSDQNFKAQESELNRKSSHKVASINNSKNNTDKGLLTFIDNHTGKKIVIPDEWRQHLISKVINSKEYIKQIEKVNTFNDNGRALKELIDVGVRNEYQKILNERRAKKPPMPELEPTYQFYISQQNKDNKDSAISGSPIKKISEKERLEDLDIVNHLKL